MRPPASISPLMGAALEGKANPAPSGEHPPDGPTLRAALGPALTRDDCLTLDRADPLAPLRELFDLPAGVVYLDGNSLGALPRATADRLARVTREEWGRGLISSWGAAGWMDLPQRVGDKIARLVGAGPGEVVAADSTSVNLYKVLSAALDIARQEAPRRRVILTERGNFPTDLYIAESLARERGLELRRVEPDALAGSLDERVAVLLLTQVNYRTGRLLDMGALCEAARAAGALTVWDLAHSAGALPVDLGASEADFAVGCGYKFLNGGPGAPAFVWVHPRHADRAQQPLAGWMGHGAPFDFSARYAPAPGVGRFLCGTPAVLAMAALDCGVDTVLAAEPLGGLAALRAKSVVLGELFMHQLESRCAGRGLTITSPLEALQRGSQVCLSPASDGQALMQALTAHGVIGDFRPGEDTGTAAPSVTGVGSPRAVAQASPGILRFGFAPLYNRFVDVWDAVEGLREAVDATA